MVKSVRGKMILALFQKLLAKNRQNTNGMYLKDSLLDVQLPWDVALLGWIPGPGVPVTGRQFCGDNPELAGHCDPGAGGDWIYQWLHCTGKAL